MAVTMCTAFSRRGLTLQGDFKNVLAGSQAQRKKKPETVHESHVVHKPEHYSSNQETKLTHLLNTMVYQIRHTLPNFKPVSRRNC